ncbi:MAG: Ig-like domain-containing protein [Propionibacteriaceae bacterium]|nr:Ig-like domain-containing protein [Propionibacteriaceae bacterium]
MPPGSPVSLRFGVGDGDPATSSFTVTPAGPLVVGDTAASQFTVTTTVRDVFHDPAPGILVTVGLDRAGPTWGPGGATCTSAADGTCSVTLTSTVAGTYRVQPRLAAGAIGTPAAITHNAGPVCFTSASEPCSGDPATQTRVEVTKNHQRADGQATDEARVRLFDVHGNPVPGQTVTAAGQGADAADLVVRSIPASAADGTTVVPFTSDAFGWHTAKVSVVVDGQEVEVTHPQSDKSSPLALHFVRVGDVPAPVITSPVSGAIVNDPTPTVQGTGEPGAVVTLTDGADMIGQAVVWADGTWEHTPAMPLADGDHSLAATQTDKDGNVSDPSPAVEVTVDTVSPSAPTVDTSEPDEVRGTADPGDQVTVADADGQGLCATTADADGEWSCAPGAELRPGDEVTVTATDPAGNQTSVTVLVLEVTVSKAALTPGEAQTAAGRFFQPGESVTAVVKPGSFAYGAATADDSGNVTFTWTIPETTPTGAYQVVLTGSLSGPGKVSFQLKEPIPATGTEAGPQTLWAAAAAGLFGSVLIVLGWRRRRDDDIDGPRRQA